jgi:streptomycin 6-kinase
MELNTTFIANIQAVYGDAGKAWLHQLPALLEELACQWNFRFIRPIAYLSFNFVGLVELNNTKTLAIIKAAPENGRLIPEIHWLQCIKKGVPKIYAVDETKEAFLMEYLTPGHSLKTVVQSGQDETATRIICKTILDLQSQQTKIFSFKHLSELVTDLLHLKGHVEDYTLSKVQSLFHDLTSDQTQDVLLHGDLHHDNIISHHTAWRVIDPHGYRGDAAAEVGAMIRNPLDCFPADKPLSAIIENRLKILSETLPFDAHKIRAWAYCMTLLSAAWNIEDFGTIADFKCEFEFKLQIAAIIDRWL